MRFFKHMEEHVIELIHMPITTLFDIYDWVVEGGLLRSTRVISVEE